MRILHHFRTCYSPNKLSQLSDLLSVKVVVSFLQSFLVLRWNAEKCCLVTWFPAMRRWTSSVLWVSSHMLRFIITDHKHHSSSLLRLGTSHCLWLTSCFYQLEKFLFLCLLKFRCCRDKSLSAAAEVGAIGVILTTIQQVETFRLQSCYTHHQHLACITWRSALWDCYRHGLCWFEDHVNPLSRVGLWQTDGDFFQFLTF